MNDTMIFIGLISLIIYFIILILLYKFVYNIGKKKSYESYEDIINTVPINNSNPIDNSNPMDNSNPIINTTIPITNNIPDTINKCTTGCDSSPVNDPFFNLKEIVKQMVLLEDHLFHEQKRCRECITKHFITIIGLAEEGLTLDADRMFEADFQKILKETTELQEFLHKTNDFDSVALKLRNLRKSFMSKVEPWIS